MKKILISGSIAYDHIMHFDGRFGDSLLKTKMEDISLSFLAKSHDVYFGGCAANVAFTLQLLGHKPLIYAVAGNNFRRYKQWLGENNLSDEYISIDSDNRTAAAYIITDLEQNQFTIFSPGAMNNTELSMDLRNIDTTDLDLVVITPGVPHRLLQVAQFCINNNIDYIFDPGQGIPSIPKEALLTIIENSKGTIVNSYEGHLLEDKTGVSLDEMAKKIDFFVQTLGEDGCRLILRDSEIIVPAISDLEINDTTGCGDAFRAGFVYGLFDTNSLERACEMGHTAASFVIEQLGTQNHKFSLMDFRDRLILNYGENVS